MPHSSYPIDNNFASHQCDTSAVQDMRDVRISCRDLARTIAKYCPEGRELSIARTKLEEVMYWANAGISRPHPKA